MPISIRVTPGSRWDRFWAALAQQPTLAWRARHVTITVEDLAAALHSAGYPKRLAVVVWAYLKAGEQ
jgi:hypothetical protein